MRKIIIQINEEISVSKVLEEKGFNVIDEYAKGNYPFLEEYHEIFERENKYYGLIRYDSHNKFIHDVELVEATDLSDLNAYKENVMVNEYREQLEAIGDSTLEQLDRMCGRIFEDDSSCIFDYGPETAFGEELEEGKMIGLQGAFAYSNTYNVWFEVVEEAEDWHDMIVKFIDLETI